MDEICLQQGLSRLRDAVEKPFAPCFLPAQFGKRQRGLAIGGREGLAIDLHGLNLRAHLQPVVAPPLVKMVGMGSEAPEGLQAPFAIDQLIFLIFRLRDHAADLGQGAEGFGALGPGAAFRILQGEAVREEEDAFFGQLDVHVRPRTPPESSLSCVMPWGKPAASWRPERHLPVWSRLWQPAAVNPGRDAA